MVGGGFKVGVEVAYGGDDELVVFIGSGTKFEESYKRVTRCRCVHVYDDGLSVVGQRSSMD